MTSTSLRPGRGPYELVLFDLLAPGAVECLLSERSAWGEYASVELLGPHHAALIVFAGGATRLTRRRVA